jgi:ribonuclease P protein component
MKDYESLKKTGDFSLVYRKGQSKANRQLVMYIRANELEKNRLGISVSKKVGNSVVRHRLTRVIREVYRLNDNEIEKGWDIVIIARNGAKDLGYDDLKKSFFHLAKLHKIVKEV